MSDDLDLDLDLIFSQKFKSENNWSRSLSSGKSKMYKKISKYQNLYSSVG